MDPFKFLAIHLAESLDANKALREAAANISDNIASKSEIEIPPKSEIMGFLRSAYQSEKLVLVLGAGVSLDYGLPSWNSLLQALLAKTFQEGSEKNEKALLFAEVFNRTFEPSPLIAARYLANQYKSKRLGFETAVKRLLYGQINQDFTSDLMKEIVQLVAAPVRAPNLNSIITYNFDDILETEIEKASIDVPFRSVFSVGQNPMTNQLPIYHVHGYIPRKGSLNSENQITLGEDLYHQQYTDVYSWSNLIQLSKFKDFHCLLVGTSFTDPNKDDCWISPTPKEVMSGLLIFLFGNDMM